MRWGERGWVLFACLHVKYRVELGQAIHREVGLLANPPVRKGTSIEG